MKNFFRGLGLFLLSAQLSNAQTNTKTPTMNITPTEQELTELSKKKWQWMADKNVDALDALFDEKSMFVHMGGTWGKTKELNVINTGEIHYKKAEVYSATVKVIGS